MTFIYLFYHNFARLARHCFQNFLGTLVSRFVACIQVEIDMRSFTIQLDHVLKGG